jgi:hypothetical protein
MHATWRDPAVQAWAAVYQAAEPAAGKDRFPVRSWVLGGAAAAVIAGVAAWFLVGALGGGGHPAGSRAFRGGAATDRAAGISFRVPAGAGWARVARPGDGFTLMLRAPAPGARTARTQLWAVAASEPLPAAIAYHGTAQLRADGILAAEAVARRYFPGYRGKLDTGVRRQAGPAAGRPGYVVTFRIGAAGRASGGITAQTAAVVIVSRGAGKRPGLLFVTVPDAMSVRLAAQIAGTARPAG